MQDFGAPVAANVNVDPNKGLQTISGLMSLQQQKQALQAQNLDIQQKQLGLESTGLDIQGKQAQLPATKATSDLTVEKVRQARAFSDMLKSGVDDKGQPLQGPDGELDPVKVTMAAGRVAPLVPEIAQGIIKTHTDKVGLQSASLALNADQNKMLQGPIQALQVDPSDQGVQNARNTIQGLVAQHPEMGPAASHATSLLDILSRQTDPNKRKEMAGKLSAMIQPGAAVQTLPQGASQATGNAISTGVVEPPVAGGGYKPSTATPMGIAPQVTINPATGQPVVLGGGGGGPTRPVGAPPSGGSPAAGGPAPAARSGGMKPSQPNYSDSRIQPMPQFPTPQEAAQAQATAERWGKVREADSSPSSGYMPTKQVYQNLLGLLKDGARTGPNSAGFNSIVGSIATATNGAIQPNSSYQEVVGYLDRLAAQNASTAGATTNFAREQAATATGSPEFNPEALTEKLRFGASVNEASHAYRTAVDAFSKRNGRAAPYNQAQFDSAWAANADPVAFRMISAHNLGDKEDIAKQNVTPLNLHHYRNLRDYLLKGQLPPDDK